MYSSTNNRSETVAKKGGAAGAAGAARAPSNDPLIGMKLKGRYLVDSEIGKGGFGAVYLARDLELLSRPVVVKVLHENTEHNEWVLRKFKHEIEALARIDHPGVVIVLATGLLPDEKPFLVMEYVEGESLRLFIERARDGMNLEHAANLIRQIGNALTAAHQKGIIHRDLKPENIMVRTLSNGDEQIKLIDFGIAKVKDAQLAPSSVVAETVGTIVYMAPEQLNAQQVTCASDIYAFGLIAYEMLTGRRAFNPDTIFQLGQLQRDGVRLKPTELRPSIPAAVDDILLKALDFDPEQRFSSADELAGALSEALGGRLTVTPQGEIVPDATTRRLISFQTVPRTNRRLGIMVAGIVLFAALSLAIGLVAALLLKHSKPEAVQNIESPRTQPAINRVISYYLMVQKRLPNGEAYQKPFRATGNQVLGDGWSFNVHAAISQGGHLYIVNEGPSPEGVSYNLLYPSPKVNGGSAWVDSKELEIGPYSLDKNQGVEKFWIVWAAVPVPELEAAKVFVNPTDRGQISDQKLAQALGSFLSKHWETKPEVEIDKATKLVKVSSTSDVLVNLLELEHR